MTPTIRSRSVEPSRPRPAAVAFDLDMTLIDSRPQVLAAYRALSQETGTTIAEDAVNRRLGTRLEDELARWFAPDLVPAAGARFRHHYADLARTTAALPGARTALDFLDAVGVSIIIVTARHPGTVDLCLEASGLGGRPVFVARPGPGKATVLRHNRVAMYIGDTPDDVRAALAAGALGVGVATGSYSEVQLGVAGAALTLGTLDEFPGCYELLSAGPARTRSSP